MSYVSVVSAVVAALVALIVSIVQSGQFEPFNQACRQMLEEERNCSQGKERTE